MACEQGYTRLSLLWLGSETERMCLYLNVPLVPAASEPAPPAFSVPLASAAAGTSFFLPPVYVLPQLLVSAVKVKMETINTYTLHTYITII